MKLTNSGGTELAEYVPLVLPRYQGYKYENQLLDGSHFVQTIGDAALVLEIQVIVTETQRAAIDTAEAEGEELTVDRDSDSYTGYIRSTPQWSLERPGASGSRIYSGSFTIAVTEEGS